MRIQSLLSAVVLALAGQAAQASPIVAGPAGDTEASGRVSVASQLVAAGATLVPMISAGAPPDTPAARIDPNLASSSFSGVVSINIRYPDPVSGTPLSFICSGTMVSPTQVLSAAHCVDSDNKGHVVDITRPGTDVRAIFPALGPGGTNAIVTANKVVMHPQYQGFGICPNGTNNCLNDDLAIITLPAAAVPAGAKVYRIATDIQQLGAVFTQVGYGVSGDGVNGYTVAPSFTVKRSGKNVFDLFDTDDEANMSPGSAQEVWYADFDSSLATDPAEKRDRLCTRGFRCGTTLGNTIEDLIGGGDSGGPSFIQDALGNYLLAGNNTFGLVNFPGCPSLTGGCFGDVFGGILLGGYYNFLYQNVIGFAVPEPEPLLLISLGLVGLGFMSRRRTAG